MIRSDNKALRLLQYSLASATFLSIQQIAKSQITYTDVDPDLLITVNESDSFDLNIDGIKDFVISINQFTGVTYSYSGNIYNYAIRRAQVEPLNSNAVAGKILTYNSYTYFSPYIIAPADGINSDDNFFPSPATFASAVSVNSLPFLELGNWRGKTDSIMAIGVEKDDNFYFGWIRLSVSAHGDSITVIDYAINSVAGENIFASSISSAVSTIDDHGFSIYSSESKIYISATTPAELQIFDLQGKLVKIARVNPGDNLIDCSELPVAEYAAKVFNDTGSYSKLVSIGF